MNHKGSFEYNFKSSVSLSAYHIRRLCFTILIGLNNKKMTIMTQIILTNFHQFI